MGSCLVILVSCTGREILYNACYQRLLCTGHTQAALKAKFSDGTIPKTAVSSCTSVSGRRWSRCVQKRDASCCARSTTYSHMPVSVHDLGRNSVAFATRFQPTYYLEERDHPLHSTERFMHRTLSPLNEFCIRFLTTTCLIQSPLRTFLPPPEHCQPCKERELTQPVDCEKGGGFLPKNSDRCPQFPAHVS